MNQKGVGVILIVILVAAALLGGYFIYQKQTKPTPSPQPTTQPSSTSDPTSNWKTYTSISGKYTLQYPSDYQLLENKIRLSEGLGERESKNTIELYSNIPQRPPMGIVFKQFTDDLSLNQLVDQESWCVDITADKGKSYQIGGQRGLIFENNICGQIGSTDLYTMNNNIFYHIYVEGGTWESGEKSLFDQILSTLKFLP